MRASPSTTSIVAARFANVGEEIVRDGGDGRIDLVKPDSIAWLAVGRDGSHTETDDADVARASLAALMQSDADSRIVSVIGGGRSSQFIREDLRAVLDGAVQESAHGGCGVLNGLADAKAAIEIADGQRCVSLVSSVEHEDQRDE